MIRLIQLLEHFYFHIYIPQQRLEKRRKHTGKQTDGQRLTSELTTKLCFKGHPNISKY